jgi:hypothetical protein
MGSITFPNSGNPQHSNRWGIFLFDEFITTIEDTRCPADLVPILVGDLAASFTFLRLSTGSQKAGNQHAYR